MAIAMSKTREEFPLSVKKVLKKTLTGTIAWIIIFLILFGFGLVAVLSAQNETVNGVVGIIAAIILVLLLLIVILTYLYQNWYYNVYFYDLTSDYVIIKKGPITPKEITIPYERVQDVYVDQDLLDRMLGIYDVHVSSATISSGMAAHIDGVEKSASDGLRAILLQTVNERIGRKRVPTPPQA